ncbi:MAG TPA: response regulator, partial [Polyangiaceae bacterium]|nr:response regulator [Polyangiaceae bacterium]
LVFVPLWRGDTSFGVIELAFFTDSRERVRELLSAAREMIATSVEAARSRAALRELLDKSRKQTDLLAAQEEELRASNRDLIEQQDELKRANDELEVQRQALSKQNTELEAMREGLLEKAGELARVSSYKSQFLANMSHELRTPLNSMLLLSHLLSENEGGHLQPKQVEFARTINAAGKDLLGLINQVLDLAKIEAGRQEVDLADTPLAELVEGLSRLFSTSIQQKGLVFELEVAPGLPATLTTDRQRLERILVNLLGNALKFTERGKISLHVGRPERAVPVPNGELAPETTLAFAVTDTGIGIAATAQQRIFAPFEQAEARTDRRYGGTGLGLSIARESALLLGGELVLESREGAGSTFTCYLPERTPTAAALTEPALRTNGKAAATDDRRSLREGGSHLLVVEDDSRFAQSLVELIHGRGFQAVVAGTGEEALRLAKEKRPQGIILDVKLPDIDGWTVIERLRRDPATRAIPVHFISAVDAPERALSLGAVGFLTKPAAPEEIVRAIRLLTRPTSNATPSILVVEDDLEGGDSVVELLRSAGLVARHVRSAGAALEALAGEPFGCIVLDLGLPDMDGLGLLETLRADPERPMPPVVVHTGRSLTREETRRIQAYAEAVVLKDGHSGARLIEEVRLFVQHLREEGPKHALAPQTTALPDVSLRGTRILVADDDMRTVYALSALLRGKGADVLVAETGREALDLLGTHPDVAAVLMDVMMPEMDGYEALRRMRADSRFARLPAIALTAKAMKGERERCLDAGASDYLTKPVDPSRLLVALQGCLGKPHGEHRRN